jgi:transcriptional regulator with XRE-family HTH domain
MSRKDANLFSPCAERLKTERERLNLNQEQAADLCEVSREMWSKYERGKAIPGGGVLLMFSANGADINYILTGQRTHLISEESPGYTLRPDQKALLDNIENCSQEDQKAIRRMALRCAEAHDDNDTDEEQKKVNGY